MSDTEIKFLDEFFEEARRAGDLTPSQDLMARVMADARAMQPEPLVFEPASKLGFWAMLGQAIGGGRGVGGLVAAALVGVGIGFSFPTFFGGGIIAPPATYLSEFGADFDIAMEEVLPYDG